MVINPYFSNLGNPAIELLRILPVLPDSFHRNLGNRRQSNFSAGKKNSLSPKFPTSFYVEQISSGVIHTFFSHSTYVLPKNSCNNS